MGRSVRFGLKNTSGSSTNSLNKTTSTTSMTMPKIKNSLLPSKVTNQFLQHILKATLLELKVLKENSAQFDELIKNNSGLESTLSKFLSNQNIGLKESRDLGKDLLKFIQDSKADTSEFSSILNKLDLHILNLINQEADREQNNEKLLNTLSGIDKEIEVSLRRDEKIYDLLRSLNLKTFGSSPEGKDKKGFSITDLVTNQLPSIIPKVMGALGLGSGGLLATIFGAKGLSKLGNKLGLTKSTGKPKVNRISTGGVGTPRSTSKPSRFSQLKDKSKNFISNSKSKLSTMGKTVGSKLSTAKNALKVGGAALFRRGAKFIPVVGTAIAVGFTLKDIYDNAKEEFFGKDAKTKDLSTKIRNVLVKTVSGIISDLSLGFLDSKSIENAINSFGDSVGEISVWLYNKAAEFLGLPKKEYKRNSSTGSKTETTNKTESTGQKQSSSSKSWSQTIVDYTPESVKAWFDTMASMGTGKDSKGKATGNLPSVKAMNLASMAQSRKINNKYTGGKATSIQNVLRGAGKCYSNVWGDIVATGLNKDGIAPTGGSVDEYGRTQMSAYNFAEWADTEKGQSKLDRVTVGSKIQNGFIQGMLPGDIVVYAKNYEAGHEHGHIEIVGTDGNLYSDFKNDPKFALKYLEKGKVKVYRLKGVSDKQSMLTKKSIKKPLVNLQAQSSKIGANTGTAQKTGTSTLKPSITDSKGFKQVAFSALEKNESKDPTKLVADVGGGFNFGKSQFNSSVNPEAWKKLGFTDKQIQTVNSKGFKTNKIQQKLIQDILLSKSKEISQLDEANKEDLFKRTLEQKKTLFESQGYSIKDPRVLGQIFDINNQGGKYLLNEDSADWMSKFSGSKEINLKGVMEWRKQRFREGKVRLKNQENRFKNVNDTFNSYTIPEVSKLKLEEANKQASITAAKTQIAMNPLNTNPQNNTIIQKRTGIGSTDLMIVDMGMIG